MFTSERALLQHSDTDSHTRKVNAPLEEENIKSIGDGGANTAGSRKGKNVAREGAKENLPKQSASSNASNNLLSSTGSRNSKRRARNRASKVVESAYKVEESIDFAQLELQGADYSRNNRASSSRNMADKRSSRGLPAHRSNGPLADPPIERGPPLTSSEKIRRREQDQANNQEVESTLSKLASVRLDIRNSRGNSLSQSSRGGRKLWTDAGVERSKARKGRKNAFFEEYLHPDEVEQGLKDKILMKGVLRINKRNTMDAYVTCQGSFYSHE